MLQSDVSEAVNFMETLVRNPLYRYLDKESYFESENPEMLDFVKSKGRCFLLPPKLEIESYLKENGDSDIKEFVEKNKKEAIVLEDDISMMGTKYMHLYVIEHKQTVKTPVENVQMIS
jgi:predicted AAA+ superfamily ATPase